jgi:nitrogen-specific signal transduction histidine kinase
MEEAELLGPGLIHEMRHPLLGIKAGLELIARHLGQRVTGLDDWQMVTTQVARLEELFGLPAAAQAGAIGLPLAVEAVVQRAVDLPRGACAAWARD